MAERYECCEHCWRWGLKGDTPCPDAERYGMHVAPCPYGCADE